MSIVFNEAAFQRIVNDPDGDFGIKLQRVSETIVFNYQAAIGKVWENQSALTMPNADYVIDIGEFGLQSTVGIVDEGRVSQYMAPKFERETWAREAIMAGWDIAL